MIKILFVCHGNICRSTMAQSVMAHLVSQAGRAENFLIDSAATSTEEIGNGVHLGTIRELAKKGVPCIPHRARQLTKKDGDCFDYIIGMDSANLSNMRRICSENHHKLSLLGHFSQKGDIADPWYTGNFAATYEDVLAGCKALLDRL